MTSHLVISALGKDRPGIVNRLSKALLDSGCNIEESRMSVLGGEFALIVLISGSAAAVEAAQDRLPELEQRLGLTIIAKPTEPRPAEARSPYAVEVVSMDHPGIVHDVTAFLSERHINIEELETDTYAAPHTGTPMFSLTMTIGIPASAHIGRLRSEFLEFCDGLNLDATLEKVR